MTPPWPWQRRDEPDGSADASAARAPITWPPDAESLENWVRTQLRKQPASGEEIVIDGLDRVGVDAEMLGHDITRLVLDGTGVALTFRMSDGAGAPPEAEPAVPGLTARTPGTLQSARAIADPLTINGIPVHLDVTVARLPIEWVRYAAPLDPRQPDSIVGIEPAETSMESVSGAVSARMRHDDIARLLSQIATPLLAAAGLRLRRLDCTVTEGRNHHLTLSASAALRWKLFTASARAQVQLQITPDAIITVKKIRLRSRNPLVAIALLTLRSSLRDAEGQTVDVNASLASDGAPAPKLHDLRVQVDDDVAVSVRFG